MVNAGASPIDPSSAVGALRVNIGDTASVPLVPPVSGQAAYANFSDIDLETFLAQTSNNVNRATGNAYLRMAAEYAATGRSIKTDDLAIDTRARGKDLLQIADYWFKQADASDAAEADEYFNIVPFARAGTPVVRFGPDDWSSDPEDPGYLMPL